MDIDFTEEQKMLKETVADFLVSKCPKTKVRELEEDEKGYSPEMWKEMADLGWMGLVIPEEYGGMGMTFQDLNVVLEEMGKNILPGPFFCTVVEGSIPILDAGSEEQKQDYLPRIASGEIICTLALLEANANYNASEVASKAMPRNGNFVINGTKLFVEMAHIADYLICAARTNDGTSPEDGITLFIVDAKTAGLHYEQMPTIGMEKLCEVQFKDVVVPEKNILGALDKGWPIISRTLEKATISKCAESLGGMQASFDMTLAYCKDRVQYERPIGAFQAIQHMVADMFITTETSRNLIHEAIWLESEGIPCTKEVAMAKAYVNEAYKKLTERAVAIHGGIGTSRDHDIGLYYRRAKSADITFGSSDFQRELVANNIGLIS